MERPSPEFWPSKITNSPELVQLPNMLKWHDKEPKKWYAATLRHNPIKSRISRKEKDAIELQKQQGANVNKLTTISSHKDLNSSVWQETAPFCF